MSTVPEQKNNPFFGLMAEFPTAEALIEATEQASAKGYRDIQAFSPFPIEGVFHALKIKDRRLPLFVLIAGIIGALTGFFFQYYVSVISYPLVIGGKPLNSWPAFIPVTFELTILFAAGTAVIGMILLNGLPQPYHPVFNSEKFLRASCDRFFLCILSRDAKFQKDEVRKFFTGLKALTIEEVAE